MPASGSSYRLSLGVDVRGALLLAAVGNLSFFLAPPPVAVDIGEALLFCIARFSFIINYGLSQKLQTGFILLILALRALRKIFGS